MQAKVTLRKQVRPTAPRGGRGKSKVASEKLVSSEATTSSGEESSSSAESPPGEDAAPAGLGEGGGGLLRPSVSPRRPTGSEGESLGRGGDLASGPGSGRVSAGPDPLRSGVARGGRLGEDL